MHGTLRHLVAQVSGSGTAMGLFFKEKGRSEQVGLVCCQHCFDRATVNQLSALLPWIIIAPSCMNKIHLALACSMHAFLLIGKFLVVLSANFCPMPFLTSFDPLMSRTRCLWACFYSLTTWRSGVCN